MNSKEIKTLDKAKIASTYGRYDMAAAEGKGVYCYDTDGKKYIDIEYFANKVEELESQLDYECECNAQFIECQKENESLRGRDAFLESKANNLNEKVSVFEADQDKIEEGIVNVLKRLNTVEDAVKTSLELASSDTTTSEDSSDVFENPISQSGESSNLFESSTTEPTVNPIEENLFSEENLENQQEEILEETEINLPIEETINFPSEDDVFNFDEPATEEEDNKPFSNQFDIF